MEKKEKQLKDFLKKISLSSKEEAVSMGEISVALNVLERVKHQTPELYETVMSSVKGAK